MYQNIYIYIYVYTYISIFKKVSLSDIVQYGIYETDMKWSKRREMSRKINE